MGLNKAIELSSGIVTNYHRIVSINNVTNQSSIIEIASYLNEEKRKEEKMQLENKKPMNIYINTEYLSIPYDKELNVDKAYEYLKTLNEFSGCKDC